MKIKVDKGQDVKTCTFKELDEYSLYLKYDQYLDCCGLNFSYMGTYNIKIGSSFAVNLFSGLRTSPSPDEEVIPIRSVLTVYPTESGIKVGD